MRRVLLIGYVAACCVFVSACHAAGDDVLVDRAAYDSSGAIGLTRSELRRQNAERSSRVGVPDQADTHLVTTEHVWVDEVGDDVVRSVSVRLVTPMGMTDARRVALGYMPPDSMLLEHTAPVESAGKDGVEYYLSESLAMRLRKSGTYAGTRMIVVFRPKAGGISEIRIGSHP